MTSFHKIWRQGDALATESVRVRVTVSRGHHHTAHGRIGVSWHLFNNNNFATSTALAEVCAVLSAILVSCLP